MFLLLRLNFWLFGPRYEGVAREGDLAVCGLKLEFGVSYHITQFSCRNKGVSIYRLLFIDDQWSTSFRGSIVSCRHHDAQAFWQKALYSPFDSINQRVELCCCPLDKVFLTRFSDVFRVFTMDHWNK